MYRASPHVSAASRVTWPGVSGRHERGEHFGARFTLRVARCIGPDRAQSGPPVKIGPMCEASRGILTPTHRSSSIGADMFKWQKPATDPEIAKRIPPGQVLTEKFPVLHFGRVPDYPDTMFLKTSVCQRAVGLRPLVTLEPTDHPLAVHQREGIAPEELRRIVVAELHRP